MEYTCTKFRVDSLSRFPLEAQTHTQTDYPTPHTVTALTADTTHAGVVGNEHISKVTRQRTVLHRQNKPQHQRTWSGTHCWVQTNR